MDLKEIRQLIKLVSETDIAEIEVREEAQTVRITRQLNVTGSALAPSQPIISHLSTLPAPPEETTKLLNNQGGESSTTKTIAITSPMVGTYYHAASPDALPFVSRGDTVKKGQVVCIIEAMKLMNEIESEYSGRIVSISKENASPVEYGEPLFVIEPI